MEGVSDVSRKKRGQHSSAYDRHHLCYIRSQWNRGFAKLLRGHHYCIVSIPKDSLHRIIHMKLHSVRPPDGSAARSVYEQLASMEKSGKISPSDPIEQRLLLLADLFRNEDQETAADFMYQYKIVIEHQSRAHPP